MANSKAVNVDNLPLEVLGEIFLLCLPRNLHCATPDAKTAPLIFLRVSSGWRKVALDNPRLWTLFCVQRDSTRKRDPETIVEAWTNLALCWLKHSGALSISFALKLDVLLNEHGEPLERRALPSKNMDVFIKRVLVDHAHRFRVLDISFDDREYLKHFLALPGNALTQLESIYLVGTHLGSDVEEAGMCTAFQAAPQLQKVVLGLRCYHGFHGQSPSFLPWHQVTHLLIQLPDTPYEWYSMFRLLKSIKTCIISVVVNPGDPDPYQLEEPITLTHLTDLDIEFHGPTTVAFFEKLYFPSLTTCKLRCSIGTESSRLGWVQSSQPHLLNQLKKLRSLTLAFQTMDDSQVLGLLEVTKDLTELNLESEIGDYPRFCRELSYHGGESILVPRLEVFKLHVEPCNHSPIPTIFSAIDFVDMITSRCGSASTTSKEQKPSIKRLTFSGNEHSQYMEGVKKEFKQRGLDHHDFNLEFDVSVDSLDWLFQDVQYWD